MHLQKLNIPKTFYPTPRSHSWSVKSKKYPELVIQYTNYSVNVMHLFLLLPPLLATVKGQPPLGDMDIHECYTGNLLKGTMPE